MGIFLSVDPLSHLYPHMSSYAYCANNPVKFIDPTGMWIAGTDGEPVIYMDGQWSSNTSIDVQRVGNAMMLTPVGKEMLGKLFDANFAVTMTLDPGFSGNRLGLADMVVSKSTGEVKSANLIIYEGALAESVKINNENSIKVKMQGAVVTGAKEKDYLLWNTTPTLTERIGQVGVHEAEHITNPNAQTHMVGGVKAEVTAVKKEMEAIKQTPQYNRKLEIPLIQINF